MSADKFLTHAAKLERTKTLTFFVSVRLLVLCVVLKETRAAEESSDFLLIVRFALLCKYKIESMIRLIFLRRFMIGSRGVSDYRGPRPAEAPFQMSVPEK